VADFQPSRYIEPQEAKRLARVSQFAVAAAKIELFLNKKGPSSTAQHRHQ
jgi:hypothetical protein